MSSDSELKRVEAALAEYPFLPEDVFIGSNGPADKVTWLIRRLRNFESTAKDRASERSILRAK